MGDVSGEVQAAEEDERLVCCALYLVNNLHSLPHLSLGPGIVYLSFKFDLKNYWGINFFLNGRLKLSSSYYSQNLCKSRYKGTNSIRHSR